jgi:hypothetical protein
MREIEMFARVSVDLARLLEEAVKSMRLAAAAYRDVQMRWNSGTLVTGLRLGPRGFILGIFVSRCIYLDEHHLLIRQISRIFFLY